MKETALTRTHIDLGAKMTEFAGYNMPIVYSGVTEEHQKVREGVGVFDVSHMGEFLLSGDNAIDLIQKISTNDASKLVDGQAQYSCMTNEKGGIVDDLLIYRQSADQFMLVVNAANIEKDWNWIQSQNSMNASMADVSEDMSLLAVQGPKALETLQKLTDEDMEQIKFYHFKQCSFAGLDNILISATGYTGSGGFEVYIPSGNSVHVWDSIFEAGKAHGIRPIGLAARDTLRLEMGFCLYGNDIDDESNPLEAGLSWITKFSKDFVASEKLKAVKEQGVNRKLVGFEMVDRGVPRPGYEIANGNGPAIGKVTSGTQSPSLGKGIGLGYVPVEYSKPDTEISIAVRNKSLRAKVVKLPFYKKQ